MVIYGIVSVVSVVTAWRGWYVNGVGILVSNCDCSLITAMSDTVSMAFLPQ